MVDVAAAAGVSRQTLYNEFGNKDGLARALMRREAEAYLRGVERALVAADDASDPGDRLAAAAVWTVRVARDNALVRAALTGCWDDWLPAPAAGPPALPGQRPAPGSASVAAHRELRPATDAGRGPVVVDRPVDAAGPGASLPTPVELVQTVSDRSLAALSDDWPPESAADLARVCETAARLAVSYVVAPGKPDEVAWLVREVLVPWRTAGQGEPSWR
ncbi:AcrR family transcriptional regulator [Streptomyces zagrosensis]|uniref:AcrR family transcriptional regulator n=2 Tax=Streptomyces zagrosensis TaxID=1042984 RepID=A0A7W9UZC0_9ACTN|nr:AcrR family transcriptional regulator [Streptomyces zagrosensis]